ncbi:MAG: hypothetical protein AAGG07_08670 [Planctomycetota bacterium]
MQTKMLASVVGATLFTATASAAPSFEFGEYEGSWFNETFMSTGAATMTIEDLGSGGIRFTIDLDGGVFGQGDPDPISIDGTVDASGLVVIPEGAPDPVFGTGSGTISAAGDVDGLLANAAGGVFSQVVLTGTAIGGEFRTRYTIFDAAGASAPFATGTLNMDLVPAPASGLLMLGGVSAIARRRR